MTFREDGQGNIIELTAEEELEQVKLSLEALRSIKITEVKNRAITELSLLVPALKNEEIIDLMIELWPMLDTTQASADILLCRDIYQYAKGRVAYARTATEAQLIAYDPYSDANWPA